MGTRIAAHLHIHASTRRPTDIDVVVVRNGKNLKGRVLGFVLGTIGKQVLEGAFEKSVLAIEARNRVNDLASEYAA